MERQLSKICQFQIKKNELELCRLNTLKKRYKVSLEQLADFIQPDKSYLVLYHLTLHDNNQPVYQVYGKQLLVFLNDYIEPEAGDGLDMVIFPENLNWGLCFNVDGSIDYRH